MVSRLQCSRRRCPACSAHPRFLSRLPGSGGSADAAATPALFSHFAAAAQAAAASAAAPPAGSDASGSVASLGCRRPRASAAVSLASVEAAVSEQVAVVVGHAVDREASLMEGLDSLGAVELRNALSAAFRLELPPMLMFDYPSAAAFVFSQLQPLSGTTSPSPMDDVEGPGVVAAQAHRMPMQVRKQGGGGGGDRELLAVATTTMPFIGFRVPHCC